METEPLLPWHLVAGFINQLTHDMRNELNSLALGVDLLSSGLNDPTTLETTGRLRDQVLNAGARLRELSVKLAEPKPNRAELPAYDLFQIWQDQGSKLNINASWDHTLGAEKVNVDVNGVAKALGELLNNAKLFGNGHGMIALAGARDGQVVFELHETKPARVDPATWGETPFHSTKRGHYGLGLWEADRLVRASGGQIEREGLPDGRLVTKFKFEVN